MMTKLAHIRENRKNNKGFSLVELIIVIAIMVALIAVMGPQYVKYVQSSRDAVIGDAAESTLSVVKSEYALNNLQSTGKATITIAANKGNGVVNVVCDSAVLVGPNAGTGYSLISALGIDANKNVKSNKVYTITITPEANGGYTFNMASVDDATSAAAVTGNVEPSTAASAG
jgi:prepilin-type N-terminal cleavage/methylation domain-containing protein